MANINRVVADGLLRQEGKALREIASKDAKGYERVSSYIACYRDAITERGGQFHRVVMEVNSLAAEPQVAQKKLKF